MSLSCPFSLVLHLGISSLSQNLGGGREDSPFSATHHRNPKPGCGLSPSQPTPNFAPQEMPSPRPVSMLLPTPSFEVGEEGGVPKVPNYNSQSPPGPGRGGTSWFSPTLAVSPCIPGSPPPCRTPPGERLPASTHPAITLTKEVSGCTLFSEPKPLTPSPGFSLPKERGQCLPGALPGLLPSLPPSAPSCVQQTLCSGGDVLCLHCRALATDGY